MVRSDVVPSLDQRVVLSDTNVSASSSHQKLNHTYFLLGWCTFTDREPSNDHYCDNSTSSHYRCDSSPSTELAFRPTHQQPLILFISTVCIYSFMLLLSITNQHAVCWSQFLLTLAAVQEQTNISSSRQFGATLPAISRWRFHSTRCNSPSMAQIRP